MKKEYWVILLTYIIMQFSGFIGVPLVTLISNKLGLSYDKTPNFSVSIWILISFFITLIITLFLLRKEIMNPVRNERTVTTRESIYWAITGIFLAFFAQTIAAYIESLLGIKMGSENTEHIVRLIKTAPILVIVTSIIGPILEEIVFRKIIFHSLYKKFNFIIAAIVSSLLFSIAHGEPEHTLLYSAMGLTFAFLYVKTGRILVPIFAHVSMNTIVVIMQLNQEIIRHL